MSLESLMSQSTIFTCPHHVEQPPVRALTESQLENPFN